MMADTSASERAYQRLKAGILSGAIPAGPLETRVLGDHLRMSVTPIREALARLNAERIVRLAPHQGYVVATPSAVRLEHLYEALGSMIRLCLDRPRRLRPDRDASASPALLLGLSYADDLTALLNDIAMAQPNAVLTEAVGALNDQLFAARRIEPKLFKDAPQELAALVALWTSQNIGDLRLRLRDLQRARLFRVDAIARRLSGDSS